MIRFDRSIYVSTESETVNTHFDQLERQATSPPKDFSLDLR